MLPQLWQQVAKSLTNTNLLNAPSTLWNESYYCLRYTDEEGNKHRELRLLLQGHTVSIWWSSWPKSQTPEPEPWCLWGNVGRTEGSGNRAPNSTIQVFLPQWPTKMLIINFLLFHAHLWMQGHHLSCSNNSSSGGNDSNNNTAGPTWLTKGWHPDQPIQSWKYH